jgi:Tetratricopeptide repeat
MRWPRSTPGSLAIYGKALGPEHPAVATLLNNLGQVDKAEGRYADAEPPIKRSLAIREKVLGRNHPDVARSLNNLAPTFLKGRAITPMPSRCTSGQSRSASARLVPTLPISGPR